MLTTVNSFWDKIENIIQFVYVQRYSEHIFRCTSVKIGSVANCLCIQLNDDIV